MLELRMVGPTNQVNVRAKYCPQRLTLGVLALGGRRAVMGRYLNGMGQCLPGELIDPSTGQFCSGSLFPSSPAGSTSTPAPSLPSGGAPVPNGAVLNYTGQWPQAGINPPSCSQAIQIVATTLKAYGLSVTASSGCPSAWNPFTVPYAAWSVTLTVQVTGSGFNSPNDVASIINGAAYGATGAMPTNFAISMGTPATGPVGSSQTQNQNQNPLSVNWTAIAIAGLGIAGLALVAKFLS